MGACNFHTVDYGPNPEYAFQGAQDKARYDFGHDPYNGTISTVSGFVMIPLEEGESYDDWAFRVLNDPNVQKWQDCACVAGADENEWHFAGWAAS